MSVTQSLRSAAASAALLRDAASRAAVCRAELQAALDRLATADDAALAEVLLILGRALTACDIDVDRIRRLLDIVTADDAESSTARVAVADLLAAAIGQNRAGVEVVIAFCRRQTRRVVDWSRPVSLDLMDTTLWSDVVRVMHFSLATHLLRMADDPLYLADLELEAFGEPEELDGSPAPGESGTVPPPPPSSGGVSETAADTQEPSPEPTGSQVPPPESLPPDGPSEPLGFTWQRVTTNFRPDELRFHRLLRILWPCRRFAGGAMSLLDVAEQYGEITGDDPPSTETISKYARGLNRILARTGFPDELAIVDSHLVWTPETFTNPRGVRSGVRVV